jgi:hypothetical protein
MWRDDNYFRREKAKRMAIADQTYYLNADKSKALPAKPYKAPAEGETFDETPEGAAYVLVREGGPISDEDAKRYGVKTREPDAPVSEEPNIVVSGGANTGPGVVKGQPLNRGDESDDKAAAKKTAKK